MLNDSFVDHVQLSESRKPTNGLSGEGAATTWALQWFPSENSKTSMKLENQEPEETLSFC